MRQHLIYDLPTRLFHWFFAALFLFAFVVAKTIDDDSLLFSYHSMAGLTLSFLVALRIIWGFFGTRHARFSNFALNPLELLNYFKGILTGSKRRWAGHNPASSWAALVMMAFALGLGITGYLMSSGPNKEDFEDVHELLANGFIIVVILHIAGIVLHTIRHREMIGFSMIDGKKADVAVDQKIDSPRTVFGLVLIALVVSFGINLYKNFDSASGKLNFFGTSLEIGESEGDGQEKNQEAEQEDDD